MNGTGLQGFPDTYVDPKGSIIFCFVFGVGDSHAHTLVEEFHGSDPKPIDLHELWLRLHKGSSEIHPQISDLQFAGGRACIHLFLNYGCYICKVIHCFQATVEND